jgi:iron(III) transport system ATP-binding protein
MLRIDSLVKTFGRNQSVRAIDGLDLEVHEGELLVLLGPSGCGKTTVLRCVAGLESADTGRITLGDRAYFDSGAKVNLPPENRGLGMVFQSYALWPHKTVRQNITYPLKARKMRDQVSSQEWVEHAAELVDCGHLLDRYPSQLSGGQQQRVALARGIVAKPDLILFDEPLSNLDALLRQRVRGELHLLHQTLGFTGVYVTHDQEEAFALGDRLAVLRAGKVEQVGTPQQIFDEPVSEYAAKFVGLSNLVPFSTSSGRPVMGEAPEETKVGLRFRPTDARLTTTAAEEEISLVGVVEDAVYCGSHYLVGVRTVGGRLDVSAPRHLGAPTPGEAVTVALSQAHARWFGPDGSRASAPQLTTPSGVCV